MAHGRRGRWRGRALRLTDTSASMARSRSRPLGSFSTYHSFASASAADEPAICAGGCAPALAAEVVARDGAGAARTTLDD